MLADPAIQSRLPLGRNKQISIENLSIYLLMASFLMFPRVFTTCGKHLTDLAPKKFSTTFLIVKFVSVKII